MSGAYEAQLLDRAFVLAERGRGTTAPNPMVGALLYREGRVIGEGWHERAGSRHAEIEALAAVSGDPAGADLYVSLEPCCYYGRTPPCTEALIKAEVARVIVGSVDPNPQVAGEGIARLRAAGIEVVVAGAPARYARQNEVFEKYITRNEAFCLLKIATTLNGMISAAPGEQTTLTGSESREVVHRLRRDMQAVAVGVGTAIIDDPHLTARGSAGSDRQPVRIVIDSTGRLPLTSRLVETAPEGPVWLVSTKRLSDQKRSAFESRGVRVLICAQLPNGRVDLGDLMKRLAKEEIAGLMVEGGTALNSALLAAGLVDKLVLFVAPSVLAGPEPLPMVQADLTGRASFKITGAQIIGEEAMIEAYLRKEEDVLRHS